MGLARNAGLKKSSAQPTRPSSPTSKTKSAQSGRASRRQPRQLSGAKRTSLGLLSMSAFDAVDGAHSAASKCYRAVALESRHLRQASAISGGLANHTARGAFFHQPPPHLLTQINAPGGRA